MKFQGPNTFCFKELQVRNGNHSFTILKHSVEKLFVRTTWLFTPTLLCDTSQLCRRNCFWVHPGRLSGGDTFLKEIFHFHLYFKKVFCTDQLLHATNSGVRMTEKCCSVTGNKKPRAIGRVRAAFTGAVTGITCWSLIVWDRQSKTMLFLGLGWFDLRGN